MYIQPISKRKNHIRLPLIAITIARYYSICESYVRWNRSSALGSGIGPLRISVSIRGPDLGGKHKLLAIIISKHLNNLRSVEFF